MVNFPLRIRVELEGVPYYVTLLATGQYELKQITPQQESVALRLMRVYNAQQLAGQWQCKSRYREYDGEFYDHVRIYQTQRGDYAISCPHLVEPRVYFDREEILWLYGENLIRHTYHQRQAEDYSLNPATVRNWLSKQLRNAVVEV